MLWVDKHRPKKLEDLSFHDDVTSRLQALADNSAALPHLFFYGPTGAGKATRVACLLRELYGASSERVQLDQRTFTLPSKKSISINLVTSKHYVQLSPGDAGLNDRFVVQTVIKDLASSGNVVAAVSSGKPAFKTVVLNQVDRLSRQAQAALRRTMEKYARSCRIILVGNHPSQVMEALQSRCLGIRVGAPTEQQIARILTDTARRQSLTLPEEIAAKTASESRRNLRRALLMLEAGHVAAVNKDFSDNVVRTDWELYVQQVATDITAEQSPARLMSTRDKLYELLVHCIPATLILETLVANLMKNLDDSLKSEVVEWAAFYEHRMAMGGSKDIFHLEAFVAKYMALYKRYLNDLFG